MNSRSLRKRFFLNSALVVSAVMLLSVFLVDISYRAKLESSTQERLRLHVFTLLSVAEHDQDGLVLPTLLRNPRFNTEASGLWAMVLDSQQRSIWHSLSINSTLQGADPEQEVGSWNFRKQRIDGIAYFLSSYKVAWEVGQEYENYYFIAAENENIIGDDIAGFRWWLGIGFVATTLSLLLFQHLVLRSAFRPIGDLEQEILTLEKGEQLAIEKQYPLELNGVKKNLNALIEKEQQQREKYRASMADLAHSLKTPMAIIRGELRAYTANKALQDAIDRVDQSIEYQLRRAVISGHSLLTPGSKVGEVLDSLVEVLQKVHCDSRVEVVRLVDEDLRFYGDENDLMEIFGNLLDNGFRYANTSIQVSCEQIDDSLCLVIEDDGAGFSDEQAQRIFTRGERLDSQGLGQGIGLAVVVDIMRSYHGTIEASRSDLGGAKFVLRFPAKEKQQ